MSRDACAVELGAARYDVVVAPGALADAGDVARAAGAGSRS